MGFSNVAGDLSWVGISAFLFLCWSVSLYCLERKTKEKKKLEEKLMRKNVKPSKIKVKKR